MSNSGFEAGNVKKNDPETSCHMRKQGTNKKKNKQARKRLSTSKNVLGAKSQKWDALNVKNNCKKLKHINIFKTTSIQ